MARGKLVARLLAGSWRGLIPAAYPAEGLTEIAQILLSSGAGSLAWHQIRNSELKTSAVAEEFRQAYRFSSIEAVVHEHNLKKVIPLLRGSGIEPLIVKGWAIARLYPETGLRPYCDFDLCVLPSQYANARAALKSPELFGCTVDLHEGFGKFYDRQEDELFARSQLVKLDDLEVRVLSEEDHLRFLCMHLLRHGAVRPIWLYDIAVAIERRSAGFNWDLCLGGSRRQADWVACAMGLAHQLLDVEIEGSPVARRAKNLPRWLVPTVLSAWGTPSHSPGQIAAYLRRPLMLLRGLIEELPHHWPNPIESTAALRGSFNNMPRLPFQVGHLFSRVASLVPDLIRGPLHHRG